MEWTQPTFGHTGLMMSHDCGLKRMGTSYLFDHLSLFKTILLVKLEFPFCFECPLPVGPINQTAFRGKVQAGSGPPSLSGCREGWFRVSRQRNAWECHLPNRLRSQFSVTSILARYRNLLRSVLTHPADAGSFAVLAGRKGGASDGSPPAPNSTGHA